MKQLLFLAFASALVLACKQKQTNALPLFTMDELTSSPENFKLLLDNHRVRVLEYTIEPGKKDSWHTHPMKSSYVISGGQLTVHLENGDSLIVEEKTGSVDWSDPVGKHYVVNTGTTPVKIILTEPK